MRPSPRANSPAPKANGTAPRANATAPRALGTARKPLVAIRTDLERKEPRWLRVILRLDRPAPPPTTGRSGCFRVSGKSGCPFFASLHRLRLGRDELEAAA